ncbi:hypothetical protein MRB53_015118 [Persea americana]|uniref:Uncharacterized protein n=1 Tax=Persea americana TaxID=3435 RepID=A0ACC2KD76_PERAE|nr:hypothetical protein MRB53_015118 [Persea americana]
MDAKLVLTDYINDMKSWTPGRLANEEFLRFLRLNRGLIITAGLPMDLFDMAVKEISSLGKKKVESSLIETELDVHRAISSYLKDNQDSIGTCSKKIVRFNRDMRNFTYWMETEVKEHEEAGNDSDFLIRKTEYIASLNSTIQQLLGDLVDIISHQQ